MTRWFKRLGLGIGGVLLLLVLVVGGAFGFTRTHQARVYEIDPPPLQLVHAERTPELLETGRRLVTVRGCKDCHQADLGGGVMVEDGAVGRLVASNLTRGEGGVVGQYLERDWVRAIRHGIGRDGRALVFMPSHEFYPIGDADLSAMIAYLESVPPVDRVNPPTRLGPLAALLYTAGKMPLLPARLIDHDAERSPAPEPGPTVAYGEYLATGCVGCHGFTFAGGRIPGAPPSMPIPTNITPDPNTGIGAWEHGDFVRVMREGIRPDGSEVNEFMPVQMTREFTDMELEAMWLFLRTLEPLPFGRR
jgi:mono/diheme cytochrome c family protein